MAKEKVNYQEVYDLYQLCSETKDLREFCADYGVNYDKFMNWQRHQLWVDTINELSATVENYRKEMEPMRKQLEAKDEVNMMLANKISNLRLQLEDSRKHVSVVPQSKEGC